MVTLKFMFLKEQSRYTWLLKNRLQVLISVTKSGRGTTFISNVSRNYYLEISPKLIHSIRWKYDYMLLRKVNNKNGR